MCVAARAAVGAWVGAGGSGAGGTCAVSRSVPPDMCWRTERLAHRCLSVTVVFLDVSQTENACGWTADFGIGWRRRRLAVASVHPLTGSRARARRLATWSTPVAGEHESGCDARTDPEPPLAATVRWARRSVPLRGTRRRAGRAAMGEMRGEGPPRSRRLVRGGASPSVCVFVVRVMVAAVVVVVVL